MRTSLIGLLFVVVGAQWSCAPKVAANPGATPARNAEQEILSLSRQKWLWMAEKKADTLAALFHDRAKFVHMSGTWGKAEEVEIIRNGTIHYKRADVHGVAVEVVDDTAMLWNRITLLAEVRGSEVSTQFTVTEVYKKQGNAWKLLALTFSSVRDDHRIR